MYLNGIKGELKGNGLNQFEWLEGIPKVGKMNGIEGVLKKMIAY